MTAFLPVSHSGPLRRILPPGVQRVGPFSELPGLLREMGARPGVVLRRVGLPADALADREGQVPFAAVGPLLDTCVKASGCSHFGLMVGSRSRLEHFGLPGEIAGSSATVGRAIEAFTNFHWLNSSGGAVHLTRGAGVSSFGYAIFEPGVTIGLDQIYEMVLAIGVRLLRQLAGNDGWAPSEILISRRRPERLGHYRDFFRAPVRFDAQASLVRFPTSFEATPVRGADETRRRVLEAKLAAAGSETILPRLHRVIRIALIFGLTSGDDVASAMGLSRRTLDRRLAECGTTFQKALEAVRFEAAQELLGDTDMQIREIAAALGFAEPSPFVRAFQRWSGSSPGRWRRAAGKSD